MFLLREDWLASARILHAISSSNPAQFSSFLGFMEQSIMIYAGNAIDCTIGVWFGLSTLTAAAFGNMISNFVGLATGGTVERLAMSVGLPSPGLTEAQRSLKIVHRVGFAGTLVG